MSKRSEMSELLLTITMVFTALIGGVVPGALFLFLLPGWIGIPLFIASCAAGPYLMHRVDLSLYGPRANQKTKNHD